MSKFDKAHLVSEDYFRLLQQIIEAQERAGDDTVWVIPIQGMTAEEMQAKIESGEIVLVDLQEYIDKMRESSL